LVITFWTVKALVAERVWILLNQVVLSQHRVSVVNEEVASERSFVAARSL